MWSISVILFYALYFIFSLLLIFFLLWKLSFYRSRVLTLFEILELLILKWFHIMFSCSGVSDFGSPWTAACQASLFFTISRSLRKLMSIESMTPSNQLMLCCPLLLPSISSSIRVFSNESAHCIRWPKYWTFSFSISPPNEYPGLISIRIHWFDLLDVQGTPKSLLQHYSLKASILWLLRLLYGPTLTPVHDFWKTIALTILYQKIKM